MINFTFKKLIRILYKYIFVMHSLFIFLLVSCIRGNTVSGNNSGENVCGSVCPFVLDGKTGLVDENLDVIGPPEFYMERT